MHVLRNSPITNPLGVFRESSYKYHMCSIRILTRRSVLSYGFSHCSKPDSASISHNGPDSSRHDRPLILGRHLLGQQCPPTYLLSARGRSKYSIVALCNSSVESAKNAIESYGLDAENTRAYGDPEALAADPDVDLIVCCTRVDTHYSLVKPGIEAGKAAFMEWPLTHDVQLTRELTGLAAEKGVRTVVGLQGHVTPVVLRIKALLEEGSLGKVLSSEVRAYGGTIDREAIASGLSYFADRKFGGNVFMIGFAHRMCLSYLLQICTIV